MSESTEDRGADRPSAPEPEDQAPQDEPAPGASSVVARIRAQRGISPHVVLRHVGEEGTPDGSALPVPLPSHEGDTPVRYEVLGELARGGVGRILRSRDVDLGREVAMKILRSKYAEDDELLKRFVEEAQVAGQLQHPGIVPVYELGLRDDGRPYFVMKLVKGRTLAAMLTARKEPSENRRRLLGIFEQVCQAMAYAHARGVIHRDLKPANIMVGAFGEVQIVDWGFAKVLHEGEETVALPEPPPESPLSVIRTARSSGEGARSVAGSVLGTPAYLPPEQALGQVDRIDERSDVFTLGGILLEILTGKPTYTCDEKDLLLAAAKCDTEEALARLDAADVDRELKRIVRRCLQPKPPDRPRDAGALAELVGNHLVGVEERARRLQLAAAEARVKVREERRRRRLTLALAAAVLLAVLAGGAVWFTLQRSEQGRLDQAARSVDAALSEGNLLRGEARAAGAEGVERWPDVIAAADRALRLAETSGAGDDAFARVEAFRKEVVAEQTEAKAMAKRAEVRRGLVRRLVTLRTEQGEGDSLDRDAKADRYREAFAILDLDPDHATAESIVLQAKASGVVEEILPALDDYVLLRREELSHGTIGEAFRGAIRELDDDPWRTEVRELAWAGNTEGLKELAGAEDLHERPAEGLSLLGEALLRAADYSTAERVIRIVHGNDPAGFWPNFRLGYAMLRIQPQRIEETIARLKTAAAADPDAYGVKYQQAIAVGQKGDVDAATDLYREVHAVDPHFAHVKRYLAGSLIIRGWAHWKQKVWESAAAAAREAIRVDPENAEAHRLIASAVVSGVMPRWTWWDRDEQRATLAEAERAAREAIRLDPSSPHSHLCLGQALLFRWEFEKAIKPCEEAARLSGTGEAAALAWSCVGVLHGANGDLAAALVHHRKAADIAPWTSTTEENKENLESNVVTTLIGLRRREEALAAAEDWRRRRPGSGRAAGTVGLCLFHLKRHREAYETYREAARLQPDEPMHHYNAAVNAVTLGDLDAAKEAWREMTAVDEARAVPLLRQGRNQFYRQKEYEAAEHLSRECVDREPDNAQDHLDLAWVLAHLGDADGAVAALERARTRDPEDRRVEASTPQILAKLDDLGARVEAYGKAARENRRDLLAQLRLGWGLHAQDDWNGAEVQYRRALEIDGDRALTHYSLSLLLRRKEDWKAAESAMREYMNRNPEDASAHGFLGFFLRRAGEKEEALAAYDEALRLEPSTSAHRTGRAWVHFECGDWRDGIAYLRHERLLLPRGRDSHASWALSLEPYEAFAASERFLRDFRENVEPDDPLVLAALGRVLALAADPEIRDVRAGLDLARRARELEPEDLDVRRAYGLASLEAGHLEEAVKTLSGVLEEHGGDDVSAWLGLARAEARRGDAKAAKAWRWKALEWMEGRDRRPLWERWLKEIDEQLRK